MINKKKYLNLKNILLIMLIIILIVVLVSNVRAEYPGLCFMINDSCVQCRPAGNCPVPESNCFYSYCDSENICRIRLNSAGTVCENGLCNDNGECLCNSTSCPAGQICNSETKKCVNDCSNITCPDGEYCIYGKCICNNTSCPSNQLCINDGQISYCAEGCKDNNECQKDQFCDVFNAQCEYNCLNINCSDEKSCNPYTGTCQPQCDYQENCTDSSLPSCNEYGVCVECTADSQCSNFSDKKFCKNDICVSCKEDSDCKNPNEICEVSTGKCTEKNSPNSTGGIATGVQKNNASGLNNNSAKVKTAESLKNSSAKESEQINYSKEENPAKSNQRFIPIMFIIMVIIILIGIYFILNRKKK